MKMGSSRMLKSVSVLVVIIGVVWLTGCGKQNSIVDPQYSQADNQAIEKIAVSDETVASFEPNYNEEDISGFVLGKVTAQVYPVKVWQKMTRVSRNFDVKYSGDTAYGKVTSNFDGVLFLAGSFSKPVMGHMPDIDTVISKKFSTVITNNVILVKTASQDTSKDHWKVVAVSLPEGGTLTGSIQIQKITLFLPNNDTLSITSPNDYYLYRQQMMGHKRMIPSFSRNTNAHIRVELTSANSDTDYVAATHGAIYDSFLKGKFRIKTRFVLVSSVLLQNGQYYKVYEANLKTNQNMGYFHAVVNAFPKGVVSDDITPVEASTWGVPYNVK